MGIKKLSQNIITGFLLLLGVSAQALDIRGVDLSYSHPNFREKLADIWYFTSRTMVGLDRHVEAPIIHLEPFDRKSQSAELTEFQNEWIIESADVWLEWTLVADVDREDITREWVREHIESIYPFPPAFRGFHYDGTNHIQVNPDTTFMPFYQNDHLGEKRDLVGYGYYVSGHEMAHVALSQKGVPEKLHHCVFVTNVNGQPSLMEQLAQFLIDRSYSLEMVKYYGLRPEIMLDPCSRLDAHDRAVAAHHAYRLSPALIAASLESGKPKTPPAPAP